MPLWPEIVIDVLLCAVPVVSFLILSASQAALEDKIAGCESAFRKVEAQIAAMAAIRAASVNTELCVKCNGTGAVGNYKCGPVGRDICLDCMGVGRIRHDEYVINPDGSIQ